MANRKRSEIDIKIGAVTYRIAPTFEVLEHIEHSCDCGIFDIILRLGDKKRASPLIVAKAIAAAINTRTPNAVTNQQVLDELIDSGEKIADTIMKVATWLAGAFSRYNDNEENSTDSTPENP